MRILMAHLITGHTMSEDSVWSRLGVPYFVPFEELDKLKTMLHQIQIETLTTLEALSSRLANIEGKMAIIEKTIDRQESSDNVFDFISREELGIEENVDYPQQEYITDPESDEIRYIESGFSAPPPEDDEIVFDAVEDDLEESPFTENPEDWASNIVSDIRSNGGSINQYWKRFGLIPTEMTASDKTSMLASLKQKMLTEGISKYNVNRMRHFYYFGTPEEGEEKYNAFIG